MTAKKNFYLKSGRGEFPIQNLVGVSEQGRVLTHRYQKKLFFKNFLLENFVTENRCKG